MNRSKIIIVVSIFLIFILLIVFVIFSNRINENNMQEEIFNDDFLLNEEESKTKDLNVPEYLNFTIYEDDGSEVNLVDYENNPVAILFFNDKDEDSLTVLDKFESFYLEYKDKIKFLMINVSQDVNNELKEKYSMPIFYDFYKGAIRNYNITEFPAMIYIDKNNEIINSKIGVPSSDALEANLDIISGNY